MKILQLVRKSDFILTSLLGILGLWIFFAQFPLSFVRIYDAVPLSLIQPGGRPFWHTISSDLLQMVYLIWAAGDSLREGTILLYDHHQFANLVERFYPLVTDPLVYLGGLLSLFLPLALSCNLTFIVFPNLVFSIATYFLLRTLTFDKPISFGFALLSCFIPYRIHLMFSSQHIAYSVFLLPLYYLALAQFFLNRIDGWKAAMVVGFLLVLMGLSEEHLAYSVVLFSWPFPVFYMWTLWRGREKRIWPTMFIQAAKAIWPIGLGLLLLVLWGKVQQTLITDHSVINRYYDYGYIIKNSRTYTGLFFKGQFGFGSAVAFFLFVSLPLVTWRLITKRATLIDLLVATIGMVFFLSSFLSVGHMPWFAEAFGWEPYEILFDNLPLFNMQRYPNRMSFVAYFTGLVLAAYGIQRLIWLAPKKSILRKTLYLAVVFWLIFESRLWVERNGEGQYFDLAKDPYPSVHQAIRDTAGFDGIILRLPAYNSATFEDTRTLLNIIHTDARFFNGYWSHIPKIYADNYSLFAKFLYTGDLTQPLYEAFKTIGIGYMLLDREFIDINAPPLQKLLLNPKVEPIIETPEFLYLKLKEWSLASMPQFYLKYEGNYRAFLEANKKIPFIPIYNDNSLKKILYKAWEGFDPVRENGFRKVGNWMVAKEASIIIPNLEREKKYTLSIRFGSLDPNSVQLRTGEFHKNFKIHRGLNDLVFPFQATSNRTKIMIVVDHLVKARDYNPADHRDLGIFLFGTDVQVKKP